MVKKVVEKGDRNNLMIFGYMDQKTGNCTVAVLDKLGDALSSISKGGW